MTSEPAVHSEATAAGDRARVRVLAIADTDSYLKWSAATLDALPGSWKSTQLIIKNPVMPSAAQIRAVTSQHVEVLTNAEVVRRIRLECPDVVLLACTGPVVAALTVQRAFWGGAARPVLVTGLPGISVPATRRAVTSRAACDLFLLHSKREVLDFAEIGAWAAPGLIFGLASLPFLPAPTPEPVADQLGPNLVFAAQAKVPVDRAHREQILLTLADAGSAVVKLRAWSEEQQTHRETWSYPDIMDGLVASGRVAADAVAFVGGSMQDVLRTSRGFVTVSSTAALEAMAMHRPTLIISDFGVSAEMINLVFQESGCIGTLDDLREGRLCQADPRWLEANYFHPPEENNWLELLDQLLAKRASGQLPARPRRMVYRGRVRRRLRLLIPAGLWPHLRRVRDVVSPSQLSQGHRPSPLAPPHNVMNEGDSR